MTPVRLMGAISLVQCVAWIQTIAKVPPQLHLLNGTRKTSQTGQYAKRQRMRVRTLKDAHNQGPNVT